MRRKFTLPLEPPVAMITALRAPIDRLAPGQTQAGFIVGTPQYLAPEILKGQEADPRADIYSCGIVLYELFAGTLPFEGGTAMEIMVKQMREEPAPPAPPASA